MILLIKADSKEVVIGLWDKELLHEKTWEAGRELSVQFLREIKNLIIKAGITEKDVSGIVVYKGPGSYTGLRISISVVNTIGYARHIPVVGATGDDWIQSGVDLLKDVNDFKPVVPFYGGEVYTTKPRK